MTASDKDKGFKPGANMPHGDYDPAKQGMSESGNHAVGHPANDVPGNQQSGHEQARAEHALRQDKQGFENLQNRQTAEAAGTEATNRGDDATGTRSKSGGN